MKDKKTPSLEQFYEELESGPDERTIEQVRADLKDLGVDADNALSRLDALVQGHLKDDRLAWKKEAAETKDIFQRAKSGLKSWTSATKEEIEKAFETLTHDAKPNPPSVAFRNRTDLSLQDKARLLDSVGILRATSSNQLDDGPDGSNRP